MKFQNIISALIIMFLCGCGAQVIQMPTQTLYNEYSFSFVDARSKESKTQEMLSYSVSNCDYGTTRVGDEGTNPNRVTYLKNSLQDKLGEVLVEKNIRLTKFIVHDNQRVWMQNSNIFGKGLIGDMLMSGGCDDPKLPGRYSVNENPDHEPAIVVEIELTVDRKIYKSRSVKHPGQDDIVLENRAPKAIDDAIAKLVFEMSTL